MEAQQQRFTNQINASIIESMETCDECTSISIVLL